MNSINPMSHCLRPALACLALFCVIGLEGCASVRAGMPSSGASRDQIETASGAVSAGLQDAAHIQIVELTDEVARRVLSSQRRSLFSETLGELATMRDVVGAGDVLEVSLWEAPPALLFGATGVERATSAGGARATALPEQMVSREGTINVPFVGTVPAAGKSPAQIEEVITSRLKGKANQPQVLVRVIRNASANVTVVGEVTTSIRMPLTAKGERLLDALAAGGGVRQPVSKMTVQVTRGHIL